MVASRDAFVLLDAVILLIQFVSFTYGCPSGCSPECPAVQYQVGEVWSVPPFPNYYTNWSSSQFFRTGDNLSFGFETGHNDVVQVSREDYESCTASNPIKFLSTGPAIVQLPDRGVFYFISNFSNYCTLGVKVSIKVHDCRNRTRPIPSPSPSRPIPPSSSPAPSPSTGNRSTAPAPSPQGYPPEPGAPIAKSMASTLSSFPIGASGILFRWTFELCLVVGLILG